jgi:hypothetical protein
MPEGSHVYAVRLASDVPNPDGRLLEDGRREPFGCELPLAVKVHGQVSLEPLAVRFGAVGADQIVARTIRLTCHDDDFEMPEPKVRLEDPRSGVAATISESARVTARRVEGKNAWDLELTLDGLPDTVERSFLARLVVETGHPAKPVLEATLGGFRRGGPR